MAKHDGTEQATEKEIVKQINASQLKELLRLGDEVADDAAEGRKTVKEAIENLRMKKHIHVDPWALARIRDLRELSAEKLADRIGVLEFYLDISGLTDKAKRAQRLPLDGKPQAPAEVKDGKVTQLRAAE
jgi:hypothetical protein